MTTKRTIFLSMVSDEFRSYRELLTADLERCQVDVVTQEKWGTLGQTTLEKLDHFIAELKSSQGAMIHVVGDALGHVPPQAAVQALLKTHSKFLDQLSQHTSLTRQQLDGCSYTQWEALLSIFHGVRLHIYRPDAKAPRPGFNPSDDQQRLQEEHFQRIRDLGRDRDVFLSEERLSSFVLADLNDILDRPPTTIPMHTGNLKHNAAELFGRQTELDRLDKAWESDSINVMVIKAWGGSGKTALTADWMNQQAMKGWRGARRVFDWSFYSQGTRDLGDTAVSADSFIQKALEFFGDQNPTLGSPHERGQRLAHLVAAEKSLLVLDGVEPLQHPPGPVAGHLTDPALEMLLRGLAAQNSGLCIVSTREHMPDLDGHRTIDAWSLEQLTEPAGAALLHSLGVRRAGDADIAAGDEELRAAVREVEGHALTLNLMGRFLALQFDGDVRQRDTFGFDQADPEWMTRYDPDSPYGHAFKVISAYERWFLDDNAQRSDAERLACRRQLAIVRLLGLFNRPASADCLNALCKEPAIEELTDELASLSRLDWKACVSRLETVGLVKRDPPDREPFSLDAHPIIRTFFAAQLREQQPEAFRAGHSRLFDHLCEVTPHQPDTLDGVQPLYQAVVHGCLAERHQEACDKVYLDRILRGTGSGGFYSMKKLGAIGADLSAVAAFFDQPCTVLSPNLSESLQAWLLNEAGLRLRAFGRLAEAVEPMRINQAMRIRNEEWNHAPASANNLSELQLTLGRVEDAVSDARRAVEFADRSEDASWKMGTRTTAAADALHQFGEHSEAAEMFATAEDLQQELQPQFPLLYSLWGFRYCDLLLAPAERAAWQRFGVPPSGGVLSRADIPPEGGRPNEAAIAACGDAEERATQTIQIAKRSDWVLDTALGHLTLARATLYRAILTADPAHLHPSAFTLPPELTAAVNGLRKAGDVEFVAKALLTAAVCYQLTGDSSAAISALNEAWQIAARGPMPLYTADILLTRARLFGLKGSGVFFGDTSRPPNDADPKKTPDPLDVAQQSETAAGSLRHAYPWPDSSPADDLAAARRIIEETHYHRRLPELEDAEAVLLK